MKGHREALCTGVKVRLELIEIKKETYGQDDEKETVEDASAEVSGSSANPGGSLFKDNFNKHVPMPETTEKYGSWMLAPRRFKRQHFSNKGMNNSNSVKDITGCHSGNNSKAPGGKFPVSQSRCKDDLNLGFISESRFAILSGEGLEEHPGSPECFKENISYGSRKGKGKEPFREPARVNISKGKAYKASTSHAQANQNRAAAKNTHTVVRGSKNATTIVSKIIYNSVSNLHSLDILEGHHLSHHGDPPSQVEDPMEEEPWHECTDGSERSGTPGGDAA
nr:uncharacterized protein LOC109162703 [Ipomoea batatas]